MSDTPEEPPASDVEGEAGEPQAPPETSNQAVSDSPPAASPQETEPPEAEAAPAGEPKAAETKAAEPKAGGPKKGISLGPLAAPKRGGPRAVITRIGLIVVAVLILATLVIGGTTVISKLGKKTNKGNPAATPTPTPSGEQYFSYSNDQFQFTIDRPQDWTTRVLQTPNPQVALALGPPSPFPNNDLMIIQVVPLTGAVYGSSDMGVFKNSLVQNLGPNINMVSQNPVSVNELPGWHFTWDSPANNPTTFFDGWYLLDGTRFIELLLQIIPPSDSASETALVPIFEHMAQSLVSYAPVPAQPQPTGTVTPAATGTATPGASPSG